MLFFDLRDCIFSAVYDVGDESELLCKFGAMGGLRFTGSYDEQ